MVSTGYKIKAAAFPKEHGSYGFTLEPLALALIIGYSTAGLYLAIGTFLAFLAHQPIRLLLAPNTPDKKTAAAFFTVYGSMALLLFYGFITSVPLRATLPFASGLVLMLFYLWMEYLHLHRRLFIEMVAPAAISLIAVSILLAGGWSMLPAFGVFFLLSARFIPTALYVHYRLQLAKRLPADKGSVALSSGIALILIAWLTSMGIIPILGLSGVAVLTVRALWGISERSRPLSVKQLGIREFIYGIVLILLASIGYLLTI
jgi:hypothetical protein